MDIEQERRSFEDYGLSRTLLQGISEKGWKVPSPVQEGTLEAALKGQDVLVRAKGDVGAYLIPCIQKIDLDLEAIQALIIVPTHELAKKVGKLCVDLVKHLSVKVMVSVGASGIPIKQGGRLAFTPHVLITLPERAVDLIEKKVAIVDHCKMLVLDEADKMPVESLNRLAEHLPQECQTLVFFDTFTSGVFEFASTHLNKPFEHELKKAQSFDELFCVTEYFEADRDKQILANGERRVNENNLSYYLYAVVKKSDSLERSDVVKCGVACDAIERWWNIVSKNKEIDHKTHQMLILHKITTDNLPPNLTSTHQFSRVLERALFSFADDFSLIKKDAKAGEGGWEDLLNRHLMTQEHVNYVAKLLANSFANPHYVTSNDCRDYYECSKCGTTRFTTSALSSHQKTCKGVKTINTSSDNQFQPSTGTKRKAEVPKKPPLHNACLLFYESVRDNTKWSDACAKWKSMSDNDKKPFTDQADTELNQYYREMKALGLKPEKKSKPEGAPTKPPRSYDLWLRDGNGDRIKQAKPIGETNKQWYNKTASAEWKTLSDEAKQPYLDQHEALMQKYKVKYAEALERQEDLK